MRHRETEARQTWSHPASHLSSSTANSKSWAQHSTRPRGWGAAATPKAERGKRQESQESHRAAHLSEAKESFSSPGQLWKDKGQDRMGWGGQREWWVLRTEHRSGGVGTAGVSQQAEDGWGMGGVPEPRPLTSHGSGKGHLQKRTCLSIQARRAEQIVCARGTSFPVILQTGGKVALLGTLEIRPLEDQLTLHLEP